jgi:hypothetical protein
MRRISSFSSLKQIVRTAADAGVVALSHQPGCSHALRAYYEWRGRFWGVFANFREAMAAAPRVKLFGYDNPP